MKLWIDDVRPAPEGYLWVKTVDEAIEKLITFQKEYDQRWKLYVLGYWDREDLEKGLNWWRIEEVSCDNDLGVDFVEGYKLLEWLEATGRNYPIRIHSANPVARERMRAIIERNGWTEVK